MGRLTHTHTFAELEVSQSTYDEIAGKLREAEYGHAFMDDGAIDMHGIGLRSALHGTAAQDGERQMCPVDWNRYPCDKQAGHDGPHRAIDDLGKPHEFFTVVQDSEMMHRTDRVLGTDNRDLPSGSPSDPEVATSGPSTLGGAPLAQNGERVGGEEHKKSEPWRWTLAHDRAVSSHYWLGEAWAALQRDDVEKAKEAIRTSEDRMHESVRILRGPAPSPADGPAPERPAEETVERERLARLCYELAQEKKAHAEAWNEPRWMWKLAMRDHLLSRAADLETIALILRAPSERVQGGEGCPRCVMHYVTDVYEVPGGLVGLLHMGRKVHQFFTRAALSTTPEEK